jgi:hypothetical protein
MGLFAKLKASLRGKPSEAVAPTPSSVDALTLALARGVFDQSPLMEKMDQEWKDKQWKLIEDELNEIVAAPIPMMKCRECMTQHIIVMCRYWVLVMKPPPEPEESGFRGLPGITGELYPHLLEIAKIDQHVRDALRGVNIIHPDWDDVYSYALFKYQQMYFRLMAVNYLRITIGDCGKGADDWLRPFLHAMSAYQEATYRHELEMPSALGDSRGMTINALAYSGFMNGVLRGEEYPDVSWRNHFAEDIQKGKLWVPEFADLSLGNQGKNE